VDNGENTLPKKIRNGEIAQYNFILGEFFQSFIGSYLIDTHTIISVVGQEELDARSVNVRNRDDVGTKAKGEMVSLDKIVEQLVDLKKLRSLENKLP
jgi:threonyl-tRNA synthetase